MVISDTLPPSELGEASSAVGFEVSAPYEGASAFESMLWLTETVRGSAARLRLLVSPPLAAAEQHFTVPESPDAPVHGDHADRSDHRVDNVGDRAGNVGDAVGDGPALDAVLSLVPTADLSGLFSELIALKALAEGLSTAVLAEAVSRGVVAHADDSPRPIGPKITAWVTAQAAAAGTPLTTAAAGTYRRVWEASRRPELAPLTEAIHTGRISPTIGARLAGDLTLLAASIPPDWWDAAAVELIAHAATGASASQLASIREALIASYGHDPADGEDTAFEEQQNALFEHRSFTTPIKDATGLWVGTYAMDNDAHAALTAALDALAAPSRTSDGELDTRTARQRNLDAIIDMCRVVATDPTLMRHTRPAAASKAQITITLDYDTLRTRYHHSGHTTAPTLDAQPAGATQPPPARPDGPTPGQHQDRSQAQDQDQRQSQDPGQEQDQGQGLDDQGGRTAQAAALQRPVPDRPRGYGLDGHGNPLTPTTIRRLACDALLIPAILGTDGAILDLGRTARLASPDQIRYLRLRDNGCTYPGCDRPPSWCEAHHLREWDTDHGPTDTNNLALLCTRHHTDIHRHHLTGHLTNGKIHWQPRQ